MNGSRSLESPRGSSAPSSTPATLRSRNNWITSGLAQACSTDCIIRPSGSSGSTSARRAGDQSSGPGLSSASSCMPVMWGTWSSWIGTIRITWPRTWPSGSFITCSGPGIRSTSTENPSGFGPCGPVLWLLGLSSPWAWSCLTFRRG